MFLYHDPIIAQIRKYKVSSDCVARAWGVFSFPTLSSQTYRKRIRKYHGRRELDHVKALKAQKPVYNFDHMIKVRQHDLLLLFFLLVVAHRIDSTDAASQERYPSFVEAVRDLDDALTMVFLFAALPQTKFVKAHVTSVSRVPFVSHFASHSSAFQLCARLAYEWQAYVMRARCLRRVFASIKGLYYQALVVGETVTWLAPYPYTPNVPRDVDYRVMLAFVEFHVQHLQFVLYRLYSDAGLAYPPREDEHSVWQGATLSGLTFAPVGPGTLSCCFVALFFVQTCGRACRRGARGEGGARAHRAGAGGRGGGASAGSRPRRCGAHGGRSAARRGAIVLRFRFACFACRSRSLAIDRRS